MSDNEDTTLEDIKAIQDVLSQDDFIDDEIEDDKPSVSNNPSPVFDSDDESQDDDADKVAAESLKSVENLLFLCKRAEQAILDKIEENAKKRQEADYQIQLLSKGGRANWRVPYNKAGMPYFKDEKHFPAPKNEDTKTKEKNNELSISHLRRPMRWTFKDRNHLRIAIRKQAANDTFEKMVRDSNENNTSSAELQPPKDLRTMVGPLGSREFDWMKISTIDMKARHTPNECRVMWNILLHPDINDTQWKNDEEELLKIKANEHGLQDWDAIAKELNTGRTGYVCFIAFHRTLENTVYNDRAWSLNENIILSECVERLRFGDFIPWGRVSTYINDRTKTQIYARWKYNLDPSLKKGRFTSDEDDLLLDSVAKFGQNFPRISTDIMPHRSSVQLSGRFKLLMLKTNRSYNSWSVAEDRKLIQLYEEFGSQWSMISSIMKKDRTYLRHRYTIVTRHMAKGTRLANIPRKRPIDDVDDDEEDEDDIDMPNDGTGAEFSIDAQLMRYFQSIQATDGKPGRKAMYHTPDQLELRTKKLDKIFEILNVKIEIPDNLDDYDLSEKNKQLLSSYKEYILQKSLVNLQRIQEYQQKMFGHVDSNDDREPYIPPAPFGLFQSGVSRVNKRKKVIFDGRLDAEPVDVEKLQVSLDMNIETPSNVLEMLTEKERDQFDGLCKLTVSKCRCLQFPGRFEQAYVQSMEQTNKPVKKLNTSDKPKVRSVSNYEHESWQHSSLKKELFIPPNYSTLLGYQTLLNFKESNSILRNQSDELTPDVIKLTNEGKQAFHLFKTRLHRLFKYPILMSRIVPKDKKLLDRTVLKEGEGILIDKKPIKISNEENNENDPTSELNEDNELNELSSGFGYDTNNLQDQSSQQEIKCEIKYDINENGQEQTKRFVLSVKLDQVKENAKINK